MTVTVNLQQRQPEPVPPATQLAAIPFLAAIDGFLRGPQPTINLRLTLHRALNRDDQTYLQQICDYVGTDDPNAGVGGGRLFPVDEGIMGAAYGRAVVMRTRRYESDHALREDLVQDMRDAGDTRDPREAPVSWLAIPFLGHRGAPVLVLFGEATTRNYFADHEQTTALVNMCWGFCRTMDTFAANPMSTLRNFSFVPAERVVGGRPLFRRVQESVDELAVPRFTRLDSFNFESAVA